MTQEAKPDGRANKEAAYRRAPDIHSTDARLLAKLLDPECPTHRLWRAEELGASTGTKYPRQ